MLGSFNTMIEQHCAPDFPIVELDITHEICPMTFVRTRLALDRLASGALLRVRLKGEEPMRNVPRTAIQQGHTVLDVTTEPGGTVAVLIRRR
jgi:tRNA 2-thiouridine synthesizing protein A